MKIHDLEYLFLRNLRRMRARFTQARQKRVVTGELVLRLSAFLVFSVSVFRLNITNADLAPAPIKPGTVLSAQSPIAIPSPTMAPRRLKDSPDLDPILAKSALVLDATSSAVLFEKEPDLILPPASTTKIITALTVLANSSLDEVVTVPESCTKFNGGMMMGLTAGERITVESLLYGLLVPSAADSACALALGHGENQIQFVAKMNELSERLGLTQTHFENPTGLDGTDQGNVSTARDVVKAAIGALKNPIFRRIVGTAKITVGSVDGSLKHNLQNTNELLNTLPGIIGVKTGFTDKAGGCLVFDYEGQGREIIGVVLGSSERGRFEDVRQIIDWVFRVYEWGR